MSAPISKKACAHSSRAPMPPYLAEEGSGGRVLTRPLPPGGVGWAPHHLQVFVFQELCQSILTEVETQERQYQPLTCEKSKPVPLKLFTPRLVKV